MLDLVHSVPFFCCSAGFVQPKLGPGIIGLTTGKQRYGNVHQHNDPCMYANMCAGEELERKAFIAITVIKGETSGGVHRAPSTKHGRGHAIRAFAVVYHAL